MHNVCMYVYMYVYKTRKFTIRNQNQNQKEYLTYYKHPAKIGPRTCPIEATIDCNPFINAR